MNQDAHSHGDHDHHSHDRRNHDHRSDAEAGSAIAAYLTGLGAVDNGVATGAPAPLSPLSRVLASVTATIGDHPATVLFAGLAPGFAGLYQVNLIVPQLVTGDYPLVVSADGVRSNAGIVSIR